MTGLTALYVTGSIAIPASENTVLTFYEGA